MAAFTLRTSKWVYNRIRGWNIFKQNVTLTYKDKSLCTNMIGGIVTLAVQLLLLAYGGFLILKMVKRTDVEWNQNIIKFDNQKNGREVIVDENDDIEIKISWIYTNTSISEREQVEKVIDFAAYHYSNDYSIGEQNKTRIEPIE